MALASNAVHKLWKWQRNERNPNGKVRWDASTLCLFGVGLNVLIEKNDQETPYRRFLSVNLVPNSFVWF